ncbi:PASTA domain-containing protein [Sphingomonas sp.]|uniref:PASTA domain-containing protein n=1 Tax=Sphingomonas sp. TaxID=28214 RepID=UPI003D6D7606
MASDMESRLLDLLNDSAAAALQTDMAQAVALRHQQLLLRQRVGAAAARLRRATEDGAPPDQISALEAQVARRSGRLDATTRIAEAADIRRPPPAPNQAQIFGRATGSVEKPPVTAAVLAASGTILARAAANADGVFHLSADGALEDVMLQLSDKSRRILYRSPEPFNVAAGAVLQIEVTLGKPDPKPGHVPDKPFMPDLIGQNERVALVLLERLGLKAKVKDAQGEGDADIVIEQAPEAGHAVSPSTAVTLTVRRVKPRKTMPVTKTETNTADLPDMAGAPLKEARDILRRLKLKVVVERRAHRGAADIVIEQVPGKGTPVDGLKEVRLVVSKAAQPAVKRRVAKAPARPAAKRS